MKSQSQVWFFFSLAHDELTEDNLKKKKKKKNVIDPEERRAVLKNV